jgi:adenylate kinase family enzyme
VRISVVGTSGSGKTTLAVQLAKTLGLPRIELDAVNWQPNWVSLQDADVAEFLRRVEVLAAQDAWVCDGNYSTTRQAVWGRATHVVWLDYGPAVFMPRVIRRSLTRAIDGKELWAGNRERWTSWLGADHPIRWAWDTWRRTRARYEQAIADPAFAHLEVHRLRHPREAEGLVEVLRQEAGRD